MTPEEQRIAIAEARGWDCDPEEAHEWGSRGQWAKHATLTGGALVSLNMEVPNYPKDLNAMHEAEKVLLLGSAKQVIHATNRYTDQLCRIMGCMDTALFQFTHATAAQRAEAFLRTLELWVDK